MKAITFVFCITFTLSVAAAFTPSFSGVSSPRVRAWDVHACPIGFVQVGTGTGCRRRRRPGHDLHMEAAGYNMLQTASPTLVYPHKVYTQSIVLVDSVNGC